MNCLDCNHDVSDKPSIKYALPDVVLCIPCWLVRHPENKRTVIERVPVVTVSPVRVIQQRRPSPGVRDAKIPVLRKPRRDIPNDDLEDAASVFAFEKARKAGSENEQEIGQDILDYVLAAVIVDDDPGGFIPPLVRERVLYRDNYRCKACRTHEHLSVHHIVPRSAGGGSHDANLVTLCLHCHDQIEIAGYTNIAQIIGHGAERTR